MSILHLADTMRRRHVYQPATPNSGRPPPAELNYSPPKLLHKKKI